MRIIRLKEVMSSTGLARSTIYKLIGSGEFPRAVPIVGRSVGWIDGEIQDWILARIEARDSAESHSRHLHDIA
ncbi:TPA: AlpA family transcriptional regulator [Pseudomonas aeruginosa]|uniref:AlpA family transcriptional regulator n=1 Tax=Pseudomonas aeruginosa TaxID=287 RepID=UPI0005B46FB0|nr:AlpA family transcriptional regulator [Pseudomonas aeruginosa]MBI8135589.1 AlpA family transcriptional regulator [Pseudomonas aeruginosa]MBI8476208.1 AlpA family transcriptional regulator [Pseudomonas aeruginosa]MBI8665544.1 AlpA family transcriptional regulator [Pseudomonas aeruginosa]MBI8917581.1 AlpA family transcriptional regulator [Pseudomonas aeruginosa]MBW6168720.1 AlpA family transcriptional regulator [Pseudomonas aeruginosa]